MFLNRSHCQRGRNIRSAEPKATECPACLHCGRELKIAPCLPQPNQSSEPSGSRDVGQPPDSPGATAKYRCWASCGRADSYDKAQTDSERKSVMEDTRTQSDSRVTDEYFLMTWADSLRSKASAEPYTTFSKTKENELNHRLLERDQVRRPHTGRDVRP
jgi:hypothetical protein